MTTAQATALEALCTRYNVPFKRSDFPLAANSRRPPPGIYCACSIGGLPDGYVAGWVGDRIYIGCSPEGAISS